MPVALRKEYAPPRGLDFYALGLSLGRLVLGGLLLVGGFWLLNIGLNGLLNDDARSLQAMTAIMGPLGDPANNMTPLQEARVFAFFFEVGGLVLLQAATKQMWRGVRPAIRGFLNGMRRIGRSALGGR